MDKYANKSAPFESGTPVEKGNYVCCQCNGKNLIQGHKDGHKLPNCPECGHTYWMKF